MPDILKVLGQANPAAGILTDLYTVPPATSATISSIVAANISLADDYFCVTVAIAGAADDIKQYIYYNSVLVASDTFVSTIGITLSATDVIRVQSTSGNVTFNLFGIEIS